MQRNVSSALLAAVGIVTLSVALPLSIARAQQAGPQDVAPASPQDQRFAAPPAAQQRGGAPMVAPGGGQFGGGMARGGGMGGATMVDDDAHLYILQGNRLFKVGKSDLRVLKEAMLPMGQPMDQPGRQIGAGGGERAK